MISFVYKTVFVCLLALPAFAIDLTSVNAINYWAGNTVEIINPETAKEHLKIKTAGNGTPSFIGWEFTKNINMNEHYVEAYIHLNNENWSGMELRLFNKKDSDSFFAVNIPKFTDPQFNWVQPDRWLKITLTMGEARVSGTPKLEDINQVGFYINDVGSETQNLPVEVLFSGVKLVPISGEPLISITFDDGLSEHMKAAEIMAQLGLRGTAYIMPQQIGHEGFLTEADLKLLYKTYGWGISAHHEVPFTEMSPAILQKELNETLQYLVDRGYGFSAPHVAFPLGKFNLESVIPQVSQRHMTSRIAGGGGETFPPADWHRLRVVNVTHEVTADVLKKRIEKAKLHNEWLILMFHHFVDGPATSDLYYDINEFKKVMQVVQQSKITTLPVHEIWEAYRVD